MLVTRARERTSERERERESEREREREREMAHNQPPDNGAGALSWEEQQMQLAMALSLGVQQQNSTPGSAPAGSTSAGSTPRSSLSAADVAAALASVTSVTAAGPTASTSSPGLTQEKLEAALAAATAATSDAVGEASRGGAVRPRTAGSTLEPSVAAAMKEIFDGITIGESSMDRDELERAVKRRAAQQAGGAALEYLASAHARATEGGVAPSATTVAVETALTVARALLGESSDAQVLNKVMQLPPAFLCLLSAEPSAGQQNALAALFRAAARTVQNAKLDDPSVDANLELFRRLVVTSPDVCRALVYTIEREAKQARRSNATFFEASTVCGVLSISPMALMRVRELGPQFSALDQMARSPGQNSASNSCSEVMAGIWDKQHAAVKKLLASKTAGQGVAKEAMLSWFSALFDLQTAVRGVPGGHSKRSRASKRDAASHGLMLNTTQILLELSAPFSDDTPKADKMHASFARLSPGWCGVSGPQRVHYEVEATLQNPDQGKADRSAAGGAESGLNASGFAHDADDEEAELAAVIEDSLRTAGMFKDAAAAGADEEGGQAGGGDSDPMIVDKWENHFVSDAFWLTLRSIGVGLVPALLELEQLFRHIQEMQRRQQQDPHLSGFIRSYNALSGIVYAERHFTSMMRFYGLVGRWLAQLSSEQLAMVPEHVVSDMSITLEHYATFFPTQLAATPRKILAPCVGAAVDLIRRGDVCRNPMVRDSLAKLLRRLIEADRHPSCADLASIANETLLGGDRVETSTGLMLLYVELGKLLDTAGVVFDKNSARQGIAQLISATLGFSTGGGASEQLSVNPAAVVSSATWRSFSDALLQESVFLFQDAMGRLGDLRGMQVDMEDAIEWHAQSEEIRREREGFFGQLQRTATGFLSMACKALSMVILLASNSTLCAAGFMRDEACAEKAGSVVTDFLERLVGGKAKDMKLHGDLREKVGFNPKELLGVVAQVLTLLCNCTEASAVAHQSFVEGVVGNHGASEARKLLGKTHKYLQKCTVGPAILEAVARLVQTVETRIAADASDAAGASVTDKVAAVQPIKIADELVTHYSALLQSDSVQDVDMGCDSVDAINHYYGSEIAANPVDARTGRAKMRRLGKECKGLREASALPCRPEASAFILCDTTRMDVFKFMLSGPTDTPYSLGLFEFHMFAPNTFPESPPVVNLRTTGNGLVRFHPNLYSDGKVCLSLLGTWHASSEIEKWHKDRSTLLQVIISIQGSIMGVEKPYYLEPGYEKAGDAVSGHFIA